MSGNHGNHVDDVYSHQKQEINDYHQKLAVTREEFMASQDNVERLTTDITSKVSTSNLEHIQGQTCNFEHLQGQYLYHCTYSRSVL